MKSFQFPHESQDEVLMDSFCDDLTNIHLIWDCQRTAWEFGNLIFPYSIISCLLVRLKITVQKKEPVWNEFHAVHEFQL